MKKKEKDVKPDSFERTHGIRQAVIENNEAEDQVLHFQNLLKYIIEHNQTAIAVLDRDMNYIYVSQRYINDYRIDDTNIIGKKHYEVFPEIPEEWKSNHKRVLSGEVLENDRELFRRSDGTTDWIRWASRPWFGPGGLIGGIIIYSEVITDRVIAEESLKSSEEQFKYFFESTNVGKSMTGIDGRLNVNKAFADMLGYSRVELSSKTWKEFTPADEISYVEQLLKPLLSGDKDSERFLKRYISKSGEEIWCDVSVSIRRDNTGKPLNYFTTVIDITERKKNEEILRESETRFRTLVESAPVGIIISDENEKTVFANIKFSEMFGYTVEDIRSEEEWWPRAYPDPGYREVMKRKWSETLSKASTGKPAATQLESKVTCRDGSIKYVVIDTVTPGDLNIVTFVDVTRRKEAEDELRKLKEKLEIKIKEKTTELIERIEELERFHEATIEREIRMKELIEENKRLRSIPDKNNR